MVVKKLVNEIFMGIGLLLDNLLYNLELIQLP